MISFTCGLSLYLLASLFIAIMFYEAVQKLRRETNEHLSNRLDRVLKRLSMALALLGPFTWPAMLVTVFLSSDMARREIPTT